MAILLGIAEALNGAPDVQQALDRTLALVADLLGLRTGWVWLVDPETQQFYSASARALPPYLQEPVRMAGSHSCWCLESFEDGELTPKNVDVMECSRLRPAVQREQVELTEGLVYHASIPLYSQGKPLGVMNLAGPAWRKLSREELRLLSIIAYQVGVALGRASLAEESRRLARAEERTRIARDIHDTLAQALTAIGLQIEGALQQLDRDPDRARTRLERALDVTRQSLEEARRSVTDLRAAPLAGKPLGEALGALGRSFTSETGIRVDLKVPEVELALPVRVESELFRIAQEALANVRKHAHAHRVELGLRVQGHVVKLWVVDDGQGFSPGHAAGPDHFGIQGMRERAHALSGRLRVETRAGAGTRVSASVPLEDRKGVM